MNNKIKNKKIKLIKKYFGKSNRKVNIKYT